MLSYKKSFAVDSYIMKADEDINKQVITIKEIKEAIKHLENLTNEVLNINIEISNIDTSVNKGFYIRYDGIIENLTNNKVIFDNNIIIKQLNRLETGEYSTIYNKITKVIIKFK